MTLLTFHRSFAQNDCETFARRFEISRRSGFFPVPLAAEHAAGQVLAHLTELIIRGRFSPKRRSTMRAGESLSWGDASVLRPRKNDAKLAGATYLYGEMEKRNSSAADSNERNICWPIAGLSSANEVFGCE